MIFWHSELGIINDEPKEEKKTISCAYKLNSKSLNAYRKLKLKIVIKKV